MDYSEIKTFSAHKIVENKIYPVPILGRNLEEVYSHFNTMAEERIFTGTNNLNGLFCPHLESLVHEDVFTIMDYFEKLKKEKNDSKL